MRCGSACTWACTSTKHMHATPCLSMRLHAVKCVDVRLYFSPQNRPVFPPESHAHGICTVCTWRVYMAYKQSPRKRKSLIMSHAHACLGMSRHVHHACRGMSTHGRAWRGMESHGDACTCMETHAHAWRRMETQGDACACRFSGKKTGRFWGGKWEPRAHF